jgi:hypothetical protein
VAPRRRLELIASAEVSLPLVELVEVIQVLDHLSHR